MPAGTRLKASGKSHEALAKYQEAVAVCADYAAGYYDLGVYYSEINQVRLCCQLSSWRNNCSHHLLAKLLTETVFLVYSSRKHKSNMSSAWFSALTLQKHTAIWGYCITFRVILTKLLPVTSKLMPMVPASS